MAKNCEVGEYIVRFYQPKPVRFQCRCLYKLMVQRSPPKHARLKKRKIKQFREELEQVRSEISLDKSNFQDMRLEKLFEDARLVFSSRKRELEYRLTGRHPDPDHRCNSTAEFIDYTLEITYIDKSILKRRVNLIRMRGEPDPLAIFKERPKCKQASGLHQEGEAQSGGKAEREISLLESIRSKIQIVSHSTSRKGVFFNIVSNDGTIRTEIPASTMNILNPRLLFGYNLHLGRAEPRRWQYMRDRCRVCKHNMKYGLTNGWHLDDGSTRGDATTAAR